jgi:ribosome-associated protein
VTSLKLAQSVAKFTAEKKAEEIVVLDMRKVVNFCDYFVICSGNSTRQVHAIADGIEDGLAKSKIKVRQVQGLKDCHWVIVDLGNVVAHIFDKETRDFYGLEHLWQEAKSVKVSKK